MHLVATARASSFVALDATALATRRKTSPMLTFYGHSQRTVLPTTWQRRSTTSCPYATAARPLVRLWTRNALSHNLFLQTLTTSASRAWCSSTWVGLMRRTNSLPSSRHCRTQRLVWCVEAQTHAFTTRASLPSHIRTNKKKRKGKSPLTQPALY